MTVTGAGAPVTVAAHGLASSVAETRPLLSGVPGTKVFYEARGHGAAPPPAVPGHAELAADLLEVADAHGATQALGASLGAGTLLRAVSLHPDRFTRLVLFLPAALDALRAAVRRPATPEEAEAWVRAAGPAPEAYVQERVARLLSPGVQALAAGLDAPVASRELLAAVAADVLVIGQEGDPVHPVSVARDVVDALPRARLHVFDRPGALVRERTALRALISAHLS